MKKISMIIACALLLVISGCSDASTNISDKKDTVLTIDGEDITKGDIYQGISNKGNITPVTTAIGKEVAKIAVPVTKDIEKEAKASLEALKKNVGEDKWADYLTTNGHKDEESYYKNVSLINARLAKVTTAYINEKFDELAKEYEVLKLQIMVSEDKAKAKDAIKELKDKKDFAEVTKKYGNTEKYNGSEGIYTNQSGIPAAIWSEILTLKDGETFEKAVLDKTTKTYYIVKVVNTNAKKTFKEDAVNAIKGIAATDENGLTMDEQAFNYYLNKAGYSIHDATIYSALLGNSLKYQED